tara:strand:+ start:1773 stop:1967 length:195 start_codon:yes stop_codon:yes gene_type:complete
MKIEIDDDTMDAIVVEKLKEYRTYFEKWDGRNGIPFEEYDVKLENKYRKKMRESIDMVLGFCGG